MHFQIILSMLPSLVFCAVEKPPLLLTPDPDSSTEGIPDCAAEGIVSCVKVKVNFQALRSSQELTFPLDQVMVRSKKVDVDEHVDALSYEVHFSKATLLRNRCALQRNEYLVLDTRKLYFGRTALEMY